MRFTTLLPAFISLGALITGGGMVASPDGNLLGFPLAMLQGSPFKSFLLPGIILFVVNGLGQGLVAVLTFRGHRFAGTALQIAGGSLVIWIFTQVSMIGGGQWLQNLYFGLGMAELVVGWLWLIRGHHRA